MFSDNMPGFKYDYAGKLLKLQNKVTEIETLVDKIRYAMDADIQHEYLTELLTLFDEESGELK